MKQNAALFPYSSRKERSLCWQTTVWNCFLLVYVESWQRMKLKTVLYSSSYFLMIIFKTHPAGFVDISIYHRTLWSSAVDRSCTVHPRIITTTFNNMSNLIYSMYLLYFYGCCNLFVVPALCNHIKLTVGFTCIYYNVLCTVIIFILL